MNNLTSLTQASNIQFIQNSNEKPKEKPLLSTFKIKFKNLNQNDNYLLFWLKIQKNCTKLTKRDKCIQLLHTEKIDIRIVEKTNPIDRKKVNVIFGQAWQRELKRPSPFLKFQHFFMLLCCIRTFHITKLIKFIELFIYFFLVVSHLYSLF